MIYIGTGFLSPTTFNDLWRYDPLSNIWTQEANLPSATRGQACGFAICGKGYIGIGDTINFFLNDLW
jgi:hypothetical protein